MSIKKHTEKDGIFLRSTISASLKDSLATERILTTAWQSNTTAHILETVEENIKKYLKTAKSQSRKAAVRESDERRRRDGERILGEISFLRNIKDKESPDFLQAQFFHLGVAVQRAEIRMIEPDALRGIKIVASAKEGGNAKATASNLRHDQWIADADEIHDKKTTYSWLRIAGELEEKYKDDPELAAKKDTIWRVIKK